MSVGSVRWWRRLSGRGAAWGRGHRGADPGRAAGAVAAQPGGFLAAVGVVVALVALVRFLGGWGGPRPSEAALFRAAAQRPGRRLAVREADLARRADFTRTVSHLQSALTRRAH